MAKSLRKLRDKFSRRAVVLEIGGFRPPKDPAVSWFGRVNLALPDETWPYSDNEPMHALCQINLTELPFRPPRLGDIDFLTLFIGPKQLPRDAANGTNWCLRTYRDIAALVPLRQVKTGISIKARSRSAATSHQQITFFPKAMPMRASVLESDYPCYDDIADDLPDDFDYDEFDELFKNTIGFKLGGWPTLIQSEISWGKKHRAKPEYVFQIGTTQKGNWMWGDNGIGYFGRGTAKGHKDEWAIDWQSY
jgi:hypothetical protein